MMLGKDACQFIQNIFQIVLAIEQRDGIFGSLTKDVIKRSVRGLRRRWRGVI